jgi:hypothetical protein
MTILTGGIIFMRDKLSKADLKKIAKFGNILDNVRSRKLRTRKWDDYIIY